MKSIYDLLSEHPFFCDFPEAYRRTVAECGSLQHWHKGDYMAHEGEEANSFYLIRHGTVSIESHAPERGAQIIQTLREGDIVGWSWIFPPHTWKFDVRALADLSAIIFEGRCLRTKCEHDFSLGYLLMKKFALIMVKRLQATRLQLMDIYGSSPCKQARSQLTLGT